MKRIQSKLHKIGTHEIHEIDNIDKIDKKFRD